MKKQYRTVTGEMSTARLADGGECDNLGVDVVHNDHPYRKNSRGEALPHSIIFCSNAVLVHLLSLLIMRDRHLGIKPK